MLDGLSLDQLRTFVAAAEAGSFSAAGRKLHRAQSMVSDLIARLESQIGVRLFDRAGRYPILTPQGHGLLADARSIIAATEGLKARARGMSQGLEPELAVVVDVFFPMQTLTAAASAFGLRFPSVPLRLYVEALGAAYQPVLDGRAAVGVVGSLPIPPPGVVMEALQPIKYVMVAARSHPLAAIAGPIARAELQRHTQLVLTDRSSLSEGREFGVISTGVWRLADVFAKHAFLLNGLGWGGMPHHVVAADLAAGRLVKLELEGLADSAMQLQMAAVYALERPPGPAGRWLIDRLRQVAEDD